ncbi:hypothetical protein RFI_14320 [Reticulomyxa filosa]|uniref:Coenzyme PQQ synthesis protein F-like C-terminal lobe domain-containing protein n=1 Tax=Reticulomyxa filosa TaxID=46433 RepID=X6NAH7_RETFI|nr:hypothetical protein RFI_14320 [Reticulomyxa filosa]|eukprot:ETO22873.1 hypothetical protein RFI_14320 [Reticulomyxa filosa]
MYDFFFFFLCLYYCKPCNITKKLFEELHIQGLVYGNAEAKHAVEIYGEIIQKYMLNSGTKGYEPNEFFAAYKGHLRIPADGVAYTLRFKNLNSGDNNSAISNEYFFTIDTPKDWGLLRLLAHIESAPCFTQLRTKEQLGYIVWSFPNIFRGLISFRVVIQSVIAHPLKLDERIENFLHDFRNQLVSMDSQVFESNKKGIINNLLEKTKGIRQQLDRYWKEFEFNLFFLFFSSSGQSLLNQIVAKEVSKLSLKDVLTFFDEYILGLKKTRAKLSIQCFGKGHRNVEEEKEEEKNDVCVLGVEDISTIRSNHQNEKKKSTTNKANVTKKGCSMLFFLKKGVKKKNNNAKSFELILTKQKRKKKER